MTSGLHEREAGGRQRTEHEGRGQRGRGCHAAACRGLGEPGTGSRTGCRGEERSCSRSAALAAHAGRPTLRLRRVGSLLPPATVCGALDSRDRATRRRHVTWPRRGLRLCWGGLELGPGSESQRPAGLGGSGLLREQKLRKGGDRLGEGRLGRRGRKLPWGHRPQMGHADHLAGRTAKGWQCSQLLEWPQSDPRG